MPRKKAQKTQVLCAIPVPMPMNQFVEVVSALARALGDKGDTFIRNGEGCYEIFRFVDEDNGDDLPAGSDPG